jgi:hypothetical protein
MTSDTIKSSVTGNLKNLQDTFESFKAKRRTTELTDYAAIGMLVFTLWFMYIAMKPIL